MITSSVQTTRCQFCFSGSFHVLLQPEWVSFEATGPVSCTSISCFSGYNNSLILTEPLTQELPEDVTRAHTLPGAARLRTSVWWRSEHAALASGFQGCCWGHARGPDTGEWPVPPPTLCPQSHGAGWQRGPLVQGALSTFSIRKPAPFNYRERSHLLGLILPISAFYLDLVVR